MSVSQLRPLNRTSLKALGPSEELVATVPDLQSRVVANGIAELNYTVPFTNSRKRIRSDSGCSLSDFEISGDELDFTLSLKRPCSATSLPFPAKEFDIELDSVPWIGNTEHLIPVTSAKVSNSFNYSQHLNGYPQPPRTRCLDQVFGGMQPAELPTNPCKHDLMLNCDQDCKLMITEHPEEVNHE